MLKLFKIYGRKGHRQAASFGQSHTNMRGGCGYSILCSDITNTNDYVLLIISENTEKEIYSRLCGQISDGIFEDYWVGDVFEQKNKDYESYFVEIDPYEMANRGK